MKRSVLVSIVVIVGLLAVAFILRSGRRADERAAKDAHPPSAGRASSPPNVLTGAERDDARGDVVLEGQVLDGDDKPVGGVSISLDTFPPRTTSTEADGSFSFTGLIERRYQVTASSAAGVAGPVVVLLRRTSDPVILHLVRPGSVTVTVVDAASRQPIAGATVEVRAPSIVTGHTGADGTVELAPVVHGHWDVVGLAPDHARGHSAVVVSAKPAVTIIALERGGSLRGRIVDEHGTPVAHARAWAVSSSDWTDRASAERDGGDTDGGGRFELVALKAGTYRVHARAHRFADTASQGVSVNGAMTDLGDLVMNASSTLKGRVVHRDGRAVPGAEVEVYIKTGLAPKTHAGSDGAFEIEDLPRADVLVTANGDDERIRVGWLTNEGAVLPGKPEQRAAPEGRKHLPMAGAEPIGLDAWRGRTVSSNPVCRKCRYALHCGGGCAAGALNSKNKYLTNYCDGFQNQFRAAAGEAYVAFERGDQIAGLVSDCRA